MNDRTSGGNDGAATPFPKIMDEIVERLSDEANERMLIRKLPVTIRFKGKRRWLIFVRGLRHHNKNKPILSLRPTT